MEKDGKRYDLSKLTRKGSETPWKFEDEDGTYFINICHPVFHTKCSIYAAVCFVSKKEDVINYGRL